MTLRKSLIMAVAISAFAGAFRRCGHAFTKEPQYFTQDFFTKDQSEVLLNEPRLVCRMAEVDPAEVHVHGLEPEAAEEQATEPTGPSEPETPTEPSTPSEPKTPTAAKETAKPGKKGK
ncbi:MAG: hypothetical protein COW30_02555 [Rhodospirillales bacterium CG15_BIG_FIL_POST_REV_8_21_14_020_66_15]|nr:MAG: hypothetical protein COW30_02555 [Rhodospirillales bacterium CG15_BIG_FIL_POST_REV_8_21_14_020_66_15]